MLAPRRNPTSPNCRICPAALLFTVVVLCVAGCAPRKAVVGKDLVPGDLIGTWILSSVGAYTSYVEDASGVTLALHPGGRFSAEGFPLRDRDSSPFRMAQSNLSGSWSVSNFNGSDSPEAWLSLQPEKSPPATLFVRLSHEGFTLWYRPDGDRRPMVFARSLASR